jgi:hypothetical protein
MLTVSAADCVDSVSCWLCWQCQLLTMLTVSAADCVDSVSCWLYIQCLLLNVFPVSWLLFTELAADCVGLFVCRDFWLICLQCLLPTVSPADCVYFLFRVPAVDAVGSTFCRLCSQWQLRTVRLYLLLLHWQCQLPMAFAGSSSEWVRAVIFYMCSSVIIPVKNSVSILLWITYNANRNL